MTIQHALSIILDFVERWNTQDKDSNVAEASQKIEHFVMRYAKIQQKQVESALHANANYTREKRQAAAKKMWERIKNKQ